MVSNLLHEVSLLDNDAQIDLVEAIWNGIVKRGATPLLSAAQEAELDRRLDEHLARPDEVFSWDVVQAELRARIAQ
jgi:putative addiction module component (TIGR02574 family)